MNDEPVSSWTAPSPAPQATPTPRAAAKAPRPRQVDGRYDVESAMTARGATMVRSSRSAMARGSPESPTRPQIAAKPTAGAAPARHTDAPAASAARTRRASATTHSSAQGSREKPWTTPRWTIWPIIAPASA